MEEHDAHTSKIVDKLKLNEFKLTSLLEITKAINNNVPTEKLFQIFEFILRNQLSIGKVIFFSYNGEKWENVFKYGVRKGKDFDVEKDLKHIKEITVVESSSVDYLNSFDIVIPVYHKSFALAYLLLGDLEEEKLNISPIIKHMTFIQTLANIIAVAIENKRLYKETLRQERMKKELELASEMQALLIPSKLPDNEHLQVSAVYQPHSTVGGDYYDYISLSETKSLFCMADVSGKGISAALLMANFQAHLRALSQVCNTLADLVVQLNKRVIEAARGEKFITLFIGIFDMETRELTYINAAHNPPVLKCEGKIQLLSEGCTGLGMFDTIPSIKEGKVEICKGSILLCFTDGVVELENEDGDSYGSEKLENLILHTKENKPSDINKEVLKSIVEFKQDAPYVDDIALLCFRFI